MPSIKDIIIHEIKDGRWYVKYVIRDRVRQWKWYDEDSIDAALRKNTKTKYRPNGIFTMEEHEGKKWYKLNVE